MSTSNRQEAPQDNSESYSYGTDRAQHYSERSSQSHAAFFTHYLKPGMALVDCGCATGTITVDLAERVAPGQVIGIDINQAALVEARQLASARGLSNIGFEEASIYAIPCAKASMDAVFTHAVLHHLAEPATALREAWRVLKPGGVLGMREPDFAGHIYAPSTGSVHRLYELWATMLQRNGGNPYLGHELRGLLHAAGFGDIIATASYETHGTPATIHQLPSTMARALLPEGTLGRGFLALGLINEAELADLRGYIGIG